MREQQRSGGINHASRYGRFSRIGPVCQETQNEEAKKNDYGNGLEPCLGNQQISLQRMWVVHIRHVYPRRAFTSYLTCGFADYSSMCGRFCQERQVECIEQLRSRATIGGSDTDKNSGKLHAPTDTGVDGAYAAHTVKQGVSHHPSAHTVATPAVLS